MEGVSISEFPGVEYGLRAEKVIEEGCLVCSIPRKVSIPPILKTIHFEIDILMECPTPLFK